GRMSSLSMPTCSTKDHKDRQRLCALLHRRQNELAEDLFSAIRAKTSATWRTPQSFHEVHEWGRAHLGTTLDLLSRWYGTIREVGDARGSRGRQRAHSLKTQPCVS